MQYRMLWSFVPIFCMFFVVQADTVPGQCSPFDQAGMQSFGWSFNSGWWDIRPGYLNSSGFAGWLPMYDVGVISITITQSLAGTIDFGSLYEGDGQLSVFFKKNGQVLGEAAAGVTSKIVDFTAQAGDVLSLEEEFATMVMNSLCFRHTAEPTADPTIEPTAEPTAHPTVEPTAEPTAGALGVEFEEAGDLGAFVLGVSSDGVMYRCSSAVGTKYCSGNRDPKRNSFELMNFPDNVSHWRAVDTDFEATVPGGKWTLDADMVLHFTGADNTDYKFMITTRAVRRLL